PSMPKITAVCVMPLIVWGAPNRIRAAHPSIGEPERCPVSGSTSAHSYCECLVRCLAFDHYAALALGLELLAKRACALFAFEPGDAKAVVRAFARNIGGLIVRRVRAQGVAEFRAELLPRVLSRRHVLIGGDLDDISAGGPGRRGR